jgi:pyruvate-formate lyase
VVKSAGKIDHFSLKNGTILNIKFHPTALQDDERRNKFKDFIRTYFEVKGSQVQFNVVSQEMLKQAKLYPEEYKNLIVKVAGYSALFSSLDEKLQDQIIARTSHRL